MAFIHNDIATKQRLRDALNEEGSMGFEHNDIVTVDVMNAAIAAGGGGGWDAIIHLEHSNDSSDDSATNLTVSIVSGTHADLSAKISDGESPCILVEYHHPWGIYFAVPMAFITYAGVASIEIVIAGYSPTRYTFAVYGTCVWFNDDTIAWD